jgi:acetyl-CoA synthetase (ADP-forming)
MRVDRERLHRALNPRSVVVVGDKGPNFQWITNLKEFEGQLWSVQLDEKEIAGIEERGVQNFKSLLDVPGEVDLLICAVPRQVAPFVVADAVKKGVGGISMFTSGFAETAEPEAVALQAKIVQACTEAGMPLVGPNCMGVYNRRLGVKFTAGQEKGEGGEVAIISQSGTHGIGMTLGVQRQGVKVTRTISIGNAAVLNECDYLEYLLDDPQSPAIAMYLEGIRDGRRFFDLLREGTKRKPVVIWRGGRSKAGARAVRSHTASLASDQAVWDALIRQTGAIPAGSLDDCIDIAAALVHTDRPRGRKIALVAMTGGQSVAITDQFERAGFEVPELLQASYDRFAEFFITVGGSYRNPFDAASTIGRETDNLQKILEILSEDETIDGGVAIEMGARNFDQDPGRLMDQLDLLERYRQKTGEPVVVMVPTGGAMGGEEEMVVRARHAVAERGFAVYPSFSRGADALGRVVDYWSRRAEVEAEAGIAARA